MKTFQIEDFFPYMENFPYMESFFGRLLSMIVRYVPDKNLDTKLLSWQNDHPSNLAIVVLID